MSNARRMPDNEQTAAQHIIAGRQKLCKQPGRLKTPHHHLSISQSVCNILGFVFGGVCLAVCAVLEDFALASESSTDHVSTLGGLTYCSIDKDQSLTITSLSHLAHDALLLLCTWCGIASGLIMALFALLAASSGGGASAGGPRLWRVYMDHRDGCVVVLGV
jgi:hypothetical protein